MAPGNEAGFGSSFLDFPSNPRARCRRPLPPDRPHPVQPRRLRRGERGL